jgi:hypothetical protein
MTEIFLELAVSVAFLLGGVVSEANKEIERQVRQERHDRIEAIVQEECAPLPQLEQIDCLANVLKYEEIADYAAQ